MAAPGLVNSIEHGQRLAADPAVLKLMLGLGANKGLHGVGMFMRAAVVRSSRKRRSVTLPTSRARRSGSSHPTFQTEAMKRLGATPVAMTLGDVLPAVQQGAIDGADCRHHSVYTPLHYQDAAKYVTEINQPPIFLIVEVSKKWYNSLPQGFAGDHRPGRRRRNRVDQSARRSNCSTRRANPGRKGRRTDQPAGRRAGEDDADARQRRRRRLEEPSRSSTRPIRS